MVDGSGNVLKLYVSNGTYRYIGDDLEALKNIENLGSKDILKGEEVVGKDNCMPTQILVNDPSLFTYSINNNEVTITGYNGVLHSYEVYNHNTCVNVLTEYIMNDYELDEPTSNYAANELRDGRTVENASLAMLLDEVYFAPGKFDEVGIKVYRVQDVTKFVDKPQCISGGTQSLVAGYGMDEESAQYAATELCSGNEVDGLTLKKALETKIVTSEYYEMLGLHNMFLSRTGNVTIPSEIEGLPVTAIGENAFYHNPISGVNLPSTLKVIGNSAFERTDITNLVIPNGVTSIGSSAFANNKLPSNQAFIYKRTDINNDGVAEVDHTTLIGYEGANKNVIIPSNVINIESHALSWNQLTSVTIPNGVVSIDDYAFYENQLTSIIIPSSITSIGKNAFDFNNLISVIIKRKSSSSDFNSYKTNLWGWADDVTCVKNNTSNVENGCITWEGSN